MSSFFKLKSSLLLLSSFFLIGCDSDTPLPFGGSNPDDVTESDELVVADEVFTFVNTSGGDLFGNPLASTLTVTSNNTIDIPEGDTSFSGTLGYESTGLQTATLEGFTDVENTLDAAVQQVLSVDNAANTEARALLTATDIDDDAPNLTDEQFTRLVVILNALGANLFFDETTDELTANAFVRYTLNVTSTQAERSAGLVAGTYGVELALENVEFNVEPFFDDEGNTTLFFIPSLVSSNSAEDLFLLEQGTYTLQLVNTVGF